MTRAWYLLAGICVLSAQAAAQAAPAGRCNLVMTTLPDARMNIIETQSADTSSRAPKPRSFFIGGGATFTCPAQSMVLIADSAEYYEALRLVNLIGNVHYTEPRVKLNSDRLTYWQNEEHLRAEGRVDATLPTGTKMVGPVADYYRAIAPIRTTARMVATGRPTIKIVQIDSITKQPSPDTAIVIANNVDMQGDTLVNAGGKVEITRPDIVSHSDSAVMNSQREFARLLGKPVIDGRGERPFQLSGAVVDLFGKSRALERVLSSGAATMVSEDVTLTSDTLDFRMQDRLLQQAFAWGKSRAHAVSPTYDILSDSLYIKMPAQRLQEVRAIRDAYAQSLPDTLKVHTRERDWLRGDTIIAYFDSGAVKPRPKATTPAAQGGKPATATKDGSGPNVRQLVALGSARSYYHIATKDTTTMTPAINYVTGRNIAIDFAERQVRQVSIIDKASGVYLEPAIDSSKLQKSKPPAKPAAKPATPSRP
ncbi:MAG: hypothetical protein M3081_14890 [Gemmatimonadota bacterium]|nr:hypothetical protein [Gemmatimonadota bacterium]